ncbi:MAG: hypothetical protein AABM66_11810 [Actinomycetota bacterium]
MPDTDLDPRPTKTPQAKARLGVRGSTPEQGKTLVIRSNLMDKGLIFSPEYGLVDFTMPHFAEFMRQGRAEEGRPFHTRRDAHSRLP